MIDFIQVGANIGNSHQDIIWPIIRERKWKGIFIEPIPHAFNKLIENYKDLEGSFFENIAIMNYNGYVDIYWSPLYNAEISSVNWMHSPDRNVNKITCPCLTLEGLFKKYNLTTVELLQIDTEGLDGLILLRTNFNNIHPKYIRFEHLHLGKNGNVSKSIVMDYLSEWYNEIEDLYDNTRIDTNEKGYDTMLERKI